MRKIAALMSIALLSGCADYLNHYDGVTLTAGDAPRQNILMQTKDPFNPASENTEIEGDGVRAADTVKQYRTSQRPPDPAILSLPIPGGPPTGPPPL